MNWKNLPYWLKGGVLGVLLCVALEIATALYILVSDHLTVLSQLNPAPGQAMKGIIRESIFTLDTLLNCTLLILIFFVLGILIGWLYGKIKNRNKAQVNGNIL